VERQDFVLKQFESADGCCTADALMGSVPVVVVHPGLQGVGAFGGVLAGEGVNFIPCFKVERLRWPD
jgi:hypothetical protein